MNNYEHIANIVSLSYNETHPVPEYHSPYTNIKKEVVGSMLVPKLSLDTINPRRMPRVEKVIFSDPVTIVIWEDGTKTMVKTHDEEFSEEHGLAMAVAKRFFGSRSEFLRVVDGAKRQEKKPKKQKKKKATSKQRKTKKNG